MVRVTGSNSLLMTPLNTKNGADASSDVEKLSDILKRQGKDSNKTAGTTTGTSEYKQVQSLVSTISSLSDILKDTGEDSLFAAAAASGSTSDVTSYVKEYVSQYNNLLNELEKIGNSATQGYEKELQNIVSGSSTSLESLGITIGKDGTLSVDEDTLSKAKLDDLKKLFNGDSSLTASIGEKSMYIGASAVANSYLSSYGASGNYSSTGVDYSQLVSMVGSYLDSIG